MSTVSAAHAARFFDEALAHSCVWTVNDDKGFPAPKGLDGVRAAPFWSTRSRVETIIANVPDYATFHPVRIALDVFRERWLPGLERDGLRVGVNWSGPRATGYELTPREVAQRLDQAETRRVDG